MDPLLQYLIRDIHIRRDNATGSALTEPAARLGLDLDHLEEHIRNSTPLVPIAKNATLHAAFGTLSIRQRIVAFRCCFFVHITVFMVVTGNNNIVNIYLGAERRSS
jgi:hypothetical protein